MYANLLGQKAYYHLTDEQMADIIGVSRTAYSSKIRSGRFWPNECQAYCKYFNKPFEFLFAVEEPVFNLGGK
jgi:DNA-binding XRE family transcriptional regulator